MGTDESRLTSRNDPRRKLFKISVVVIDYRHERNAVTLEVVLFIFCLWRYFCPVYFIFFFN